MPKVIVIPAQTSERALGNRRPNAGAGMPSVIVIPAQAGIQSFQEDRARGRATPD
jgi:hypothetical protein